MQLSKQKYQSIISDYSIYFLSHWLVVTLRMEIRKTLDITFCCGAKMVSAVCINAYWGEFDISVELNECRNVC